MPSDTGLMRGETWLKGAPVTAEKGVIAPR